MKPAACLTTTAFALTLCALVGPAAAQDLRKESSPPAGGQPEAGAPATINTALPATINLSNAGTGQLLTWGSQRASRAEIQAAIASGRMVDVFIGGGAASDVVAAGYFDAGPNGPRPVLSTARFAIGPRGEVGVTVMHENGEPGFMPVSQRGGPLPALTPPPGAVNYAETLGLTDAELRAGAEPKILPKAGD